MKRVVSSKEYQTPQERFLDYVCSHFKVNGPYASGERVPEPVDLAINESAFPHSLRARSYDCEVVYDGLQIEWEAQDPFNGKDAEKCGDEIVRFLEAIYEYYINNEAEGDQIKFPTGTIRIQSRYGRDEGFYIRDI